MYQVCNPHMQWEQNKQMDQQYHIMCKILSIVMYWFEWYVLKALVSNHLTCMTWQYMYKSHKIVKTRTRYMTRTKYVIPTCDVSNN